MFKFRKVTVAFFKFCLRVRIWTHHLIDFQNYAVVGCRIWARPKDILYHRFPKEGEWKEWVILGGKKRVNCEAERICSIYFKKADYDKRLKYVRRRTYFTECASWIIFMNLARPKIKSIKLYSRDYVLIVI